MVQDVLVPNFEDGPGIFAFCRRLSESSDLSLDFSKVGYASPSGMVILAQAISQAVNDGKIASFTGAKAYSYPANLGFFKTCGLDVARNHARGGQTYYPVTVHNLEKIRATAAAQGRPIGKYVDQMVGRLAHLVTQKTSGNLFYLVRYCLRELIRNAAEHSMGDKLVVCGQYWPGNNKVELALIDNGIGMQNSLARNKRFSEVKDDLRAVRLALLPSISGAAWEADEIGNAWSNSGFGLYVTSQLARECGEFCISSGTTFQSISGQTKSEMDFALAGTFVSMVMHVGQLQSTDKRVGAIVERGESFAKRHLKSEAGTLASAASKFIVA